MGDSTSSEDRPVIGDCIGDNSTLGYSDQLVNHERIDAFTLLNLNQLIKEVVLYQRIWTMRPSDSIVSGLTELKDAFRFFMLSDFEELGHPESEVARQTKVATRLAFNQREVSQLWSRVLGKEVSLSGELVNRDYPSPVYYNDGTPSSDRPERLNPTPFDQLPPVEFAVASTFRSNLYLELSKRLKVRYVSDILRAEYVEWKLRRDTSMDLGPNGLEILKKTSTVLENMYGLKRRSFDSHQIEFPLEFPFFLFLALDGAKDASDVLLKIKALRNSGEAKRIRNEIKKIEGGGKEALESLARLDNHIADLTKGRKSNWPPLLKGAISLISFSPVAILTALVPQSNWQDLIPIIVKSGGVTMGLNAGRIFEVFNYLSSTWERRQLALIEHLIAGAKKEFRSSFLQALDDMVFSVWKKKLSERDRGFMAAIAPLAFT